MIRNSREVDKRGKDDGRELIKIKNTVTWGRDCLLSNSRLNGSKSTSESETEDIQKKGILTSRLSISGALELWVGCCLL